MRKGRYVVSCEDEDDALPYFETGQSYEIETRPKLRSVSEAAHRAISMTKNERGPLGFRIPN